MRIDLRTLLFLMTLCGALFAWLHLLVYAGRCESFFVPIEQVADPINPRFLHDRSMLRAPDGRTYQRPFDPLTGRICFLFAISASLAVTLSELSRRRAAKVAEVES